MFDKTEHKTSDDQPEPNITTYSEKNFYGSLLSFPPSRKFVFFIDLQKSFFFFESMTVCSCCFLR